jgi:purine-binding chemotaxis protein CheW
MTSTAARSATLEHLATPDDFDLSAEASSTRHAKVLMFSLAGHLHCAGLGSVREIIPLKPVTPLPGSPVQVCGLINLRGTIVTVLDATMSEYGVSSMAPTASILLVELGTRVAGVVVDEVHDIGLLDKDVPFEALLDLGALVQMALV